MKKIACITGASSGIGRATAFLLAEKGFNLILCGRRKQLLTEISAMIKSDFKVDTKELCFDIRSATSVSSSFKELQNDWKNIDVLINNAGLALGLSEFQNCDIRDWETMIDTNVKGTLYVSKLVVGFMIERKQGHIINIGSIAGKQVYKMGNVYCASKHAVDAITKSMRIDLLEYGIKVSSINPGNVFTEFSSVRFKDDEAKASAVYQGYQPLVAEDIAETIHFIISRPKHVNINDLDILPTAQANAYNFLKKF